MTDARPSQPTHTPAATPPTPEVVAQAAGGLSDLVRRTPVQEWSEPFLQRLLPADTRVLLKLELFQHTGSFKVRGAFVTMRALSREALDRGVVAVSAGNHAAAVAFAASRLGSTARVVMPRTANPSRIALCRALGADVVLAVDVHEAFETARRIETDDGRTFVHPFEGPAVATGTATLAAEFLEQAPGLQAVVVPVGGGGLAAGIASLIKQLKPAVQVFGVEPEGADSMTRSFAAGSPQPAGPITTIADSLAPPYALPYSFGLCHSYLDGLVLVSDDDLCAALFALFRGAKLAVEPAGAAATAALLGPLRERLAGLTVGLIVCGANVDPGAYARYLARGASLLGDGARVIHDE